MRARLATLADAERLFELRRESITSLASKGMTLVHAAARSLARLGLVFGELLGDRHADKAEAAILYLHRICTPRWPVVILREEFA